MTGRRPYRLGKRQASVDATKRRILDAAVLEYSGRGIPDTSMQAVARRADVAPGTVLYHYPTPNDLAEAVIERWLVEMETPSPDLISADDPLEVRVRRLVEELFGLYQRSEIAYLIHAQSPEHPVLKRYETWWEENVGQMLSRALGEQARDLETARVVSVLVNPGFRGTLIGSGIPSDRTVGIAAELALAWLEKHS